MEKTDTELAAMAIPARNDYLDDYAAYLTDCGDTYDPDAAYELHLETRGWAEQAAFEDWESRMGLISYEEARELAERIG